MKQGGWYRNLIKNVVGDKSGSRTYFQETFPRQNFLRRAFPRRIVPLRHLPNGQFQDGLFPKDLSPKGQLPGQTFPRRTVPRMTLPRKDSSLTLVSPNHIFHFKNKKVIDMNYVISEVSVSAIITENFTKRNGTFSISELLVLLEMFKRLQFFLLNLYFRKLKTTHTHDFAYYIKSIVY